MTFRLPSIVTAVEFRREQYGWTRTVMAKKLGLHRGHYNEFINRRRALPRKAMCKAFELGVPAEVLLQTRKTKRDYERREAEALQAESKRRTRFINRFTNQGEMTCPVIREQVSQTSQPNVLSPSTSA